MAQPVGGGAQHMQDVNQSPEALLAHYRLGRTLGVGSFGKVKIAEHNKTGHKVAIKILNRRKIKQMDMEEKVLREIKILRLFMHPHIIRLYEVIETTNDIYVVMEFVKAGELFDYIVEKGRLLEDEARSFFQQIVSGVEYCHRNMVVHRDLKPENLLLDSQNNVKIADFGLSNVMRDGHFMKTSCGSPNYAAPEVISGKLYAGPEVDVWSCGVILFALLCGSLPFDDESIPTLFKKIKGGVYNVPTHLSPPARDLITRMLLVDALKRITIPEIRQHPWFTTRLPRYLAVMQADTVASATCIDEDIVSEVVKLDLGYLRPAILDALKGRHQNKATVAYYLKLDSRLRASSSKAYLKGELSEAQEAITQNQTGLGDHGRPTVLQQRLVAERRWRLGIQSRGHPSAIIAELLRALRASQVMWKKGAPYNFKCRKIVQLQDKAASIEEETAEMETGGDEVEGQPTSRQRLLKFEVQMYRMREGEYVVDFQKLQGELFLFMDLCSTLFCTLRL